MADAPQGAPWLRRLWASWPYLLAAALFALGLFALSKLLAPVNPADIASQVRATPWTVLALALVATLCGYLCLAGYDWSALRYIGKPLPLPIVLTGGLMAYAFGNTMGLSAVSGGAVRWRIYSGLGLDGYDIAAVSTFAAVSFGVAATLVGVGALAIHPGALGPLLPFPPGVIRAVAVLTIIGMVAPLVWASVTGRSLRIWKITIRAPSLGVLASQVAFSFGDIAFSCLTLFILLPPSDMGYFGFLAVFAAATMAGVVSHVPGGIGVFETVVIAALPPSIPVEQAAAALILYRMIYFLLPFTLALVVLAAYELWRGVGGRQPGGAAGRLLRGIEPALRAVGAVAPPVLAALIFGSGLWMTLAPLIPPTSQAAEAAEAFFPLAFVEGSALISSALGAALIVLSLGVARRNAGAFLLSLGAMAAGAVMALLQGFDIERAGALALAFAILVPFRPAFHRRAVLTHAVLTPSAILLTLSTLTALGFVLFFATKSTPFANEMWLEFALDARAPRALRAGLVASLLVFVATLALLLRSPRFRPAPPDEATLAAAAAILGQADAPDAAFALIGDKAILLGSAHRAFVAFGVQGRSWVALGGPVGPAGDAADVAWEFVASARRAGARPVFYEVGARHIPLMLDLGMSLHKIGEEAMIDLATFSLEGPGRRGLRATHARAGRDGLTFTLSAPPHAPALMARLRVISDAWLAAKGGREKGFSVGRFDEAWLGRWRLALAWHGGEVVGFANLLETGPAAPVTLDLMRHARPAPPGTMEYLFTATLLALKAEGAARFSLGMAPLAGLAPERSRRIWDKFGAAIFRHGGHFYNFAGLRAFKQKFDPDWRPRYLAVPTALPPLLPLADAARLIARQPIPARG